MISRHQGSAGCQPAVSQPATPQALERSAMHGSAVAQAWASQTHRLITGAALLPLLFAVVFLAAHGRGATIVEDFSSDPAGRGWRAFGDPSLFHWNSTNENLDVTWDSSRTNSYFWLPLGTILSRADDFNLSFDIRLRDIAIGTTTNKSYTFEIALGLLRMTNAAVTNFFRGAGVSSAGPRNLVEFDYFPDSGYGATFSPTVATTNNAIIFSDNHPLVMSTGDLFHITMSYSSSNRVVRTAVLKNGVPYTTGTSNTLKDITLTGNQDFRVDALGVMSYSDAIQVGPTQFWGSILAHGTVDNVSLSMPPRPSENLAIVESNGVWCAQFRSLTNWVYALERSLDLKTWAGISATNEGTGGTMVIADTNTAGSGASYRVQALRR